MIEDELSKRPQPCDVVFDTADISYSLPYSFCLPISWEMIIGGIGSE